MSPAPQRPELWSCWCGEQGNVITATKCRTCHWFRPVKGEHRQPYMGELAEGARLSALQDHKALALLPEDHPGRAVLLESIEAWGAQANELASMAPTVVVQQCSCGGAYLWHLQWPRVLIRCPHYVGEEPCERPPPDPRRGERGGVAALLSERTWQTDEFAGRLPWCDLSMEEAPA